MPITRQNHSLKIGYVPLLDSVPLLVAKKMGYFEEENVNVTLEEEVGWATVRDKLIHGELDMAATLLGMPYALHHGVGCYKTEMTIPLIINANGNTITLTKDLTPEALDNPEEIATILNARAAEKDRKWTFATVNPYSSHLILLFQWLNKHLKSQIGEIEIVFLPPQLFPDLLEQGMIDGYCAGEPWGTVAEKGDIGWIATNSIQMSPGHAEKVLATPRRTIDFAPEGVKSIGKAILKACKDCDNPEFRGEIISILSEFKSLGLEKAEIEKYVNETVGDTTGRWSTLHKFSGGEVNKPTAEKEQWVLKGLKEAGLFRKKIISTGLLMDPSMIF